MPTTPSQQATEAAQLADQALALIGKMKVGGWESIQSLALTSIAKSLAVLAAQQTDR